MGMVVALPDGSDSYEFDDSFELYDLDLASPPSIQKAVLQHGGRDLATGQFDAREITLRGVIFGDTRAEYESKLSAIAGFIYPTLNLQLYPDSAPLDRYLILKRLVGLKQRFARGLRNQVAQVDLDFVCEDPFWQDVSLTTVTGTLSSGIAFSTNNPGTVESPLRITFQAAANNPLLSVQNTSDANLLLTYSDLAFTNGSTVVLDATNGTVLRGAVNVNRFMTGSFMRVLSGANTYVYTGEDVYYALEYRPRYI